jgi:hypothetical protein
MDSSDVFKQARVAWLPVRQGGSLVDVAGGAVFGADRQGYSVETFAHERSCSEPCTIGEFGP